MHTGIGPRGRPWARSVGALGTIEEKAKVNQNRREGQIICWVTEVLYSQRHLRSLWWHTDGGIGRNLGRGCSAEFPTWA